MSAVEIRVAAPDLGVLVGAYDADAFDRLRERADLFAYRDTREPTSRQVVVVPLGGELDLAGFAAERVPIARHRRMYVRLLERRLPDALPELKLRLRRFGLERIRATEDLVAHAFRDAGLARPASLQRLRKHHRTQLIPRTEFVRGRGSLLLVALQFDTKFVIDGTAADLIADGADIRGLHAIRDGEYAGRILEANGSTLSIGGEDGPVTAATNSVTVEPSMESFKRLFGAALGSNVARYDSAERRLIAAKLSGTAYIEHLRAVVEHLRNAGDCALAPGVSFRFGSLLGVTTRGPEAAARLLPPVEYCFSPDRSATDTLPSRGLDKHGPLDGRSFDRKEPHLLVVGPAEARGEVERFVVQLRDGLGEGAKRFGRGLVGTYRLSRVRTSLVDAPIAGLSRGDVGAGYVAAMRDWYDPDRRPDAALVVLREDEAFMDGPANPYQAAKAWLLSQGIPSQDIRLPKMRARSDLPYILEDLALALYAKLGGCPWTVAPSRPLVHEIVLGMAYAEFGERFRSRERYMGLTAVFTSDGSYVLAAATRRCLYKEYTSALAETVGQTVARLKREQAWLRGDSVRLVFHTVKPLTKEDISRAVDAAVAAVGPEINVEIAVLTIRRDHPFTVADPAQKGRQTPVERFDGTHGVAAVGEAAPERGLCIDLGDRRRLLVVTGSHLIRREGDPVPQPLLLELHDRSTFKDMTALTRQVFQLTGLSWRSVRPASEPVTLQYPRLIAKLIARLEHQPGWSDSLLSTQLARSRWFL